MECFILVASNDPLPFPFFLSILQHHPRSPPMDHGAQSCRNTEDQQFLPSRACSQILWESIHGFISGFYQGAAMSKSHSFKRDLHVCC